MNPQTSPTAPSSCRERALALHQAGRLEEAASAYRAMLAHFPGNPLLMTGLGTIALQLGTVPEGVRQLEAALAIEPAQPMAVANLGMALGVPKLVTHSLDDYCRLARKLASDRTRYAAIRRRVAERRNTSPLFDSRRFTANLEQTYVGNAERDGAGQGTISAKRA